MKITFISTVSTAGLAQAAEEIKQQFNLSLQLKVYCPRQIDEELIDDQVVKRDLQTSDAVCVDIRGSGRAIDLVYESLKEEKNIVVNLMAPMGKMMEITRLGSFSGKSMANRIRPEEARDPEEVWKKIQLAEGLVKTAGRIIPMGRVRDAGNYVSISRYWRYGGKENYRNLLLLLLRDYLNCSLPKAKEPLQYPEYGIFHPKHGYFPELESFCKASGFDEALPTVGVLFYGNMHFDQCQSVLKGLLENLFDCNTVPVFSDGIHNLQAMNKFFFRKDRPIIDALVNLTWFRLNGGPLGGNPEKTRELLSELNVPVFAPACMYSRKIEEWKASETGLSPMESIMAVIWPELDGCIEPIPCCGVQDISVGELQASEVQALPDRVERIALRIRRWMELKNKSNAQKRIAIIIYNYPPGEANLGVASYLDVFASVHKILQALRDNGYRVVPPERELHRLFQDCSVFNTGSWHRAEDALQNCFSLNLREYMSFFSSLPESMQKEVIESWGEAPGKVMVAGERIVIPGLEMGNIFLGIQPARPPLGEADLTSASHDKTKPPHHQYLAFYHWLQEIWKADMVVHVGTHGLAEFTKGKEVGLSNECFPDLLIGSMPHLYFYHVVNTSEVVIAKRRLYATTLGYNSPPFTTSDLYEGYAELEDLIDEYSQSRQHGDLKADIVQEKIFKKAGELKIEGRDVPGIHDELYEMKRRIIPKGLHILGEIYERKDLQSFFEFILRYDREGIKSLNRILAESKGLDYDQVLHNRESFVEVLKEIDRIASHLCGLCLEKSVDFAVMESGISSKTREELRETLSYGLDFLEKYSSNDAEITGLLRGLEAGFIEQAAGGDVIRTPDILPTGRNLTQFDPNRIPTQTAMQRGQEIAENTICVYQEKDASYPETVGLILWGFETTKTGGESIGQILSYLGVRIIRDAGSWAPRLEVISLEELRRPRVDCLVNICGFFRDMFPNIVLLLDRAFNLVAELDEDTEKNFVRKHSLKNKEDLKSANLDERTALKMANGRVFGPKAGEYGTRMLPLLEDSIWKTEEELAEVFIQSMDHLYTENLHAVKSDELYRANLSRVELVSQVRDTHDREIIDLDHYYEFFGGLSRAVQMEKGEPVRMLISDTTEEVIHTEDVARAINRGARTRLLNPRWANAMLSHEFHGAQQIADRVENMLGLAATTHSVENWIWSAIAERYLFDREMNEKLTNNNSFAAAAVAERLLEAEKRGHWQATTEEMEKLRAVYLDVEGDIEEGLNRE